MKLYFRPMPILTVITVIMLAILIALGTWQYQRLQWKTNLLAEIEAVADAPPFESVADVQKALDAGEPIDFRRIEVKATVIGQETPYFVFTASNRDVSWRVFRPVREGTVSFFAGQETVFDADRDDVSQTVSGPVTLTGYVRLARKVHGATKSTPGKNRWFGFNSAPEIYNWADHVPGGADVRFYVDTVPGAQSANALPARRPDIRNNHFDYMLTWYGLAIVLFVIYLILHRRAGRLGRS